MIEELVKPEKYVAWIFLLHHVYNTQIIIA